MWRIWLSGVKYGGDDDAFDLIVVSTIEIDAVTCYVSYSFFFAYRARSIYCYRVDGGWNADVDAGARRVLSHHSLRFYSRHLGVCGEMYFSDALHLYFAAKV